MTGKTRSKEERATFLADARRGASELVVADAARHVDRPADSPVHLPTRIDGSPDHRRTGSDKCDRSSRPSRDCQYSCELSGLVAQACVCALTLRVHTAKYRNRLVDVIDDPDLVLVIVMAVQTSGVLGHRSPPSDRHREHQGVQAWIVEPLAEVTTGRSTTRGLSDASISSTRRRALMPIPPCRTATRSVWTASAEASAARCSRRSVRTSG